MKNNVLAEFNYNGKTYIYYTESDDSNSIKYGILDNDTIVEIKDQKDIEIMNEASKQIFISSNPNNHIKLGTITYNGKQYQQMLDIQSQFKFFYEIKEDKYYWPSKEDAIELFELFNSQNLYMASYDNEIHSSEDLYKFLKQKPAKKPHQPKIDKSENAKKIFKKILLYSVDAVAVVTFGVALRTISIKNAAPVTSFDVALFTIDNEVSEASLEIREKEYDEDKLISAIDSNDNLTPEEKVMYKEHIPFVRKYKRYVNFNDLINAISNGNIHYVNYINPGVSGDYTLMDYSIRVYNSTNFYDAPKSVLGHEIGHNFSGAHGPLCSGAFEATNEIVNSEKEYADDVTAYYDIIAFQKVLIEIIGETPFAAFYQSGNSSYILKALESKIDDKYLPYQLMAALDNVLVYNDIICNYYGKYSEKQIEEAKANKDINNRFIIDTLSKYFEAEKGYPMNEDVICMLYLTSIGVLDEKFNVSDGTYTFQLGCGGYTLKKGYFLDDYISKYPEYNLIYTVQIEDEVKEIRTIINDSNRRIVSKDGVYDIGLTYYVPKQSENKPEEEVGSNVNTSPDEETQSQSVEYNYDGHGIAEALNELFIFENSSQDQKKIPENRIEQVTYLKILYEIIGKEPFDRFIQNNFDSIEIMNALTNIFPDKEMAKELIDYIDIISDYNNNKGSLSQEEWDKKLNGLSGIRSQISHFLYVYFESAKGYLISDDALISFYRLEMKEAIPDFMTINYYRVRDVNGNEIMIKPNDGTKVEVSKPYMFSPNGAYGSEATVKITPQGSESSMYITINDNNRHMRFEKNIPERFQFFFDEGIDKEK